MVVEEKKNVFCFLRLFLCLTLAILGLPLEVKLASDSETYLPLPLKC